MRGTFGAGIDRIRQQVGRGHLRGQVEVDQVYAKYQHERTDLHHPDGGGPFFLRDPLFEHAEQFMEHLANKTITSTGSSMHDAMADNMEHLSREVYLRAPWEFGDLRASGHPSVTLDGEVVYDRHPNVSRLDAERLRIKSHLRSLFDPNRYRR